LAFIDSENFTKLIDNLGLNSLKGKLKSQLNEVTKAGIKGTTKDLNNLNASLSTIKNSNSRTVLGYATNHTNELRSELTKSILGQKTKNGKIRDSRKVIDALKNKSWYWERPEGVLTDIKYTRANFGTILNTTYADMSRQATKEAFKNTDTRFRYEGGTIPTSSEICEWLYNNQDPNGYTMEEIEAGIVTPHGVVDAFGRQPNNNCIHTWQPIEIDRDIIEIEKESERLRPKVA
jgi:hypothetical protein